MKQAHPPDDIWNRVVMARELMSQVAKGKETTDLSVKENVDSILGQANAHLEKISGDSTGATYGTAQMYL